MNKNEKLIDACERGNLKQVKKLLNRLFFKPDANAKRWDGTTPLMFVSRGERGFASFEDCKSVIELLIAKGANLNVEDNYGSTPLTEASWNGKTDIVELLISKGADVNYTSHGRSTPLMCTAQNGNKIVAEMLIDKGADINFKDRAGSSILHWASDKGNKDVAELLIDKGANVNAKDFWGRTPLLMASTKGHKDVTELLIAKGADVNSKDKDGNTSLIWALKNGHNYVVELLKVIGTISQTSLKLIYEALRTIESLVQINIDYIQVDSIGSEGILMNAGNKLKEAFRLQPDNPFIHYAYASCLHLALQNKSAKIEMRNCAQLHPDFILAKIALEGWDIWHSMFSLPLWGADTKTLHPYISQMVKKSVLISVRDGIIPRAVIFLRVKSYDFININALKSAYINIASVISPVSDPQVIGIYVKINDNPYNPYGAEVLQIPFTPRGDKVRSAYEYLCIQEDVDLVIIDNNDIILLNKRISIPNKMKATNNKILQMLQGTDGMEYSTSIIEKAIIRHKEIFSISNVDFRK